MKAMLNEKNNYSVTTDTVASMKGMKQMSDLLKGQKVIPVVALDDEQQALGLAAALLRGGVSTIEITLRTSYGLGAIEVVKQQFPEMLVLAGTVNSAIEVSQVVSAGVDGIVSPGITDSIVAAVIEQEIAYLPGVATPSDILRVLHYGYSECKLFPASVVGGLSALKAYSGPFSEVSFCPTGGVNETNYKDYLALQNVMCVGGSWSAPDHMIKSQDWEGVFKLCSNLG